MKNIEINGLLEFKEHIHNQIDLVKDHINSLSYDIQIDSADYEETNISLYEIHHKLHLWKSRLDLLVNLTNTLLMMKKLISRVE